MEKQYWLMKSEPESYGIKHLARENKTAWNGVRNFQARNFMRDGMRLGDTILYYHSNCKQPGIYGLARVASAPYPDPTQFDNGSHYYDAHATKEKPVWYVVDISFERSFKEPVLLNEMRQMPELSRMMILQTGSRLSVTPVDEAHATRIISLAT